MPDTIVQVANACEVTTKTRLLTLLSPAHTGFLILKSPQTGIYQFA